MQKRIVITGPSFALLRDEESFLGRSNIELVEAATKEEVLELHAKNRADLIVVDHGVPEMEAEDLCTRVRESREMRKVSIIVVGTGEGPLAHCSPRFPANAVVPSPVNTPLFFETAYRLLSISPRAAFRTPLGVKFQGTRLNKPFICYANDISVSGMLFDSEQILQKGDLIECGFLLPDGTPVRTRAEVMRVVPKGRDYDSFKYGVKFHGLSEDARAAIESHVLREPRHKP